MKVIIMVMATKWRLFQLRGSMEDSLWRFLLFVQFHLDCWCQLPGSCVADRPKSQPNFGRHVNRQFSWQSAVLKYTWYCRTPLCVKNCPCLLQAGRNVLTHMHDPPSLLPPNNVRSMKNTLCCCLPFSMECFLDFHACVPLDFYLCF